MDSKAREKMIGNVQLVYTIFISLAVVEAMRRLLADYGLTGKAPPFTVVAAVLSLLVTAVPFHQGTNRYLEATYVTGERSARTGAMLIDLSFVFLQGLLVLALGLLIPTGKSLQLYYTTLAFLFLIHTCWVGLTNLAASTEQDKTPEFQSWALANVGAAVWILVSVWSLLLKWNIWPTLVIQSAAVLFAALGRTIYDYSSVWSYHYPVAKPAFIMPLPRPAPVPKEGRVRKIEEAKRKIAAIERA